MKVSKAHKQDRFNSMEWEWISPDTVLITLVDNKTGKSGKYTAQVIEGQVVKVLEDGDMK